MSNVLILSGSPRKNGNTDLLVSSFANGAKINHEVEIGKYLYFYDDIPAESLLFALILL